MSFFPEARRNKQQQTAGYQTCRLSLLGPICAFRMEKRPAFLFIPNQGDFTQLTH